MTLRFSKKEIIILVVAVLLTISLLLSGYFFYLSPKKTEIETKSVELKSAQDLFTALQKNQTETSPVTVESVAALQRKVPVKLQLEQLILDLEKAEVVSGSQIKNMAFSEADVGSSTQQNTAQQQQTSTDTSKKSETTTKDGSSTTQTKTTEQTNQQTNSNQTASSTQTQATTVPAGIKKLTATLQVESPSYEELRKFIETLENLPRILVVDSVTFSSSGEVTNLDTEVKKLSYTLTLSAFYMPTLTDLQSQLPELAAPKPGNKTDPFSSFPDLPAEDQTK